MNASPFLADRSGTAAPRHRFAMTCDLAPGLPVSTPQQVALCYKASTCFKLLGEFTREVWVEVGRW